MPTDSLAHDDVSNRESRRTLISADRVQGSTVFSLSGDKLGHIEDVMLNKASGHVAYAIMSYGGFLGAGERYHPLPWSMLTFDAAKNGYTVPLTREQLDGAPTLGRDDVDREDDSVWAQEVHTHYKLPGPFI
jgi:sporulation protein YlmC with PRC-barrel domain